METINLLCFPFAGGQSYSYRGLGDSFDFVTVSTFDLPGHGKRLSEPLLDDINYIIDDMFNQIQNRLRQPYAFFGHSMGGCLAYLMARRVIREGSAPPVFLFISGRKGPAVVEEGRRHLLPKPQFFKMLEDLGGCPPMILADPELMDLYEPILRADFAALASYRHQEAAPLDIPFLVMIGTDDEIAEDEVMQWQRETTRPLRIVRFPGDHFFIFQHWREIRRLFVDCLKPIHESNGAGKWTMI